MANSLEASHVAVLAPGQGQKLVLGTLPTPTDLKPYELLVDVKAVSINPVDWKVRDRAAFARLFEKPWPKVLGIDAAGVVLDKGSDVKNYQVGDRVVGYVRMNKGALVGSFQSRVTFWSTIAFPIPPSMSFAEAATFPLAYSTATSGLNLDLGIPLPGEEPSIPLDTPILILGGASAIGQLCIQLLKHAGFEQIVTTASSTNHDLVKSLGAKLALDYQASVDQLTNQIEQWAGGKVKYIYDTISAPSTIEVAKSVVDPDGGKVVLSGTTKDPFPGTSTVIATFGGRVFDATSNNPYDGTKPHEYDFGQKSWAVLSELVSQGKIKPIPVRLIEQGDLAERLETGLRLSSEGKISGEKAVILF